MNISGKYHGTLKFHNVMLPTFIRVGTHFLLPWRISTVIKPCRNIVTCHSLPSYITLTNLSSAILLRKSSFKSLQGYTVPAKVDSTVAVTYFTVTCTINDAYSSYTAEGTSKYLHVLATSFTSLESSVQIFVVSSSLPTRTIIICYVIDRAVECVMKSHLVPLR